MLGLLSLDMIRNSCSQVREGIVAFFETVILLLILLFASVLEIIRQILLRVSSAFTDRRQFYVVVVGTQTGVFDNP